MAPRTHIQYDSDNDDHHDDHGDKNGYDSNCQDVLGEPTACVWKNHLRRMLHRGAFFCAIYKWVGEWYGYLVWVVK